MDAEKIFNWYIQDLLGKKEHLQKADELKKHTTRVVKLCEKLATSFSDGINEKLLLKAAWFHDIAKIKYDDEHNKRKKVKKILEKCAGYEKNTDEMFLLEIIFMHKGCFDPLIGCALESAILRICDKLDKVNKVKEKRKGKELRDDLKKVERECFKSLESIEDSGTLSENQFHTIREFCLKKLRELETTDWSE